jgi:2-dehydropantoate 2-reductase
MRILIYGAGAVGNYLGAHLALGGHQVTLLGRERLAKAIESHGLTLSTEEGNRLIPTIHTAASLEVALQSGGPYDWIAFTMKAYDTIPAIHEVQRHLPEPPPIACFQNGLGNEESLRDAFGDERIVAATLTTAVSMSGDATVVEERRRGAAIARDASAAPIVEQALRDTSLRLVVIDQSASLKWSKLLLNIIGNATSAILDMPPSEVFKHPGLFKIEREALREALAIMDLKDIPVVNLPGSPAKLLATAVRWIPAFLLRPILRKQVAGGRGDKLPSLLVTMRSGRRETEAAWLNGGVAQAASAMKRLTPVNHALALTVTDIAAGRVPWETYRHRPDALIRAIKVVMGMPR